MPTSRSRLSSLTTIDRSTICKADDEKALREKGLFRLEGKEYIVKDGDIISIRFNV